MKGFFSKNNIISLVIAAFLSVVTFFVLLFLTLNLNDSYLLFFFGQHEGLILGLLCGVFALIVIKVRKSREGNDAN